MIKNEKILCALLEKNQYIAVKGSFRDSLHRKCDLLTYRGSGYGLKGFSVPICMFEVETTADINSWTIVGPGSNFSPKFATLEELKEQIICEVNKQDEVNQEDPQTTTLSVPVAETGIQNKDNEMISPGLGEWGATWYCGNVKGKTSFIPLHNNYKHPPDFMCGPDDGMQCIACKWAQDLNSISTIEQMTCHTAFKKLFEDHVKLTKLFKGTAMTLKVCNGRLNVNQGTKVIFSTALEMLEDAKEIGGYLIKSIDSMKISPSSVECVVKISRRASSEDGSSMDEPERGGFVTRGGLVTRGRGAQQRLYNLHLRCKGVKNNTRHDFDGYKREYTECSFHVSDTT